MDANQKVSLIICARNRKTELLECLESLQKLDLAGIDLETIVVDNASTDDTYATVHARYPAVEFIRNAVNQGTARSRNQAVQIARGAYVWSLDSDTVASNPAVLRNMLDYFRAHPDTGSVGGQMINDGQGWLYWVMGENGDEKIPVAQAGVIERWPLYLPTCNCLMRKDLLVTLGGFDEFYFYYSEDLDLQLRIRKHGLRNVFHSACCVRHHFAQNQRRGTYYLFYRNALRCLIVNRSAAAILYFPFAQLHDIIQGYVVFRQSGADIRRIKTLNDSVKKSYTGRFGVGRLALRILLSLAGAWLWNVGLLPATLYRKYHPRRYLNSQYSV